MGRALSQLSEAVTAQGNDDLPHALESDLGFDASSHGCMSLGTPGPQFPPLCVSVCSVVSDSLLPQGL